MVGDKTVNQHALMIWRKIGQGKEEFAGLYEEVRKAFSDNMMFEQRPEGSENTGLVDI